MNETDVRTLIRAATDNGVTLWAEDGRLHFKARKGMSEVLRAALQSRKNELIGELSRPVFRKREGTPDLVRYPWYWKDFWDENQANPSMSHGLHFALRLTGEVPPERVASAFERLISRHDLLRSRVRLENGTPCLVLENDCPSPLEFADVSAGAMADRPARVKAAIERAIFAPFEDGQVFRARLIRVSECEYVVAVVIHHFVADGVTLGIVGRELTASLQDEQSSKSPGDDRPLQYSDYLLGMNEWLDGEGLRYRLDYWRKNMRGAPPVRFPLTEAAQSPQPAKLEVMTIPIDEALRAKFARATQDGGIPFATAVLAANFAALATALNSTDLVTIIIHSGRHDAALMELVGFTVNCFPIRVTVRPETSYAELLASVDDAYALARDYHIPWALLMRSLREIDVSCVAPIFNYLPGTPVGTCEPASSSSAGGVGISFIPVERSEQTNSVDWKSHEVSVADSGVRAAVTLKYMPSRYRSAAVHEFAAALSRCMQMMAEDPTRRIGDLSRTSR